MGASRAATTASASSRSTPTRIFVIFQRLHAAGRLRGHRHRAGDVQEDRRVPRRAHLARHRPRPAAARRSASPCPRIDDEPRSRGMRARDDAARTPAIDVLLVEDDPGDVLMTREAFEDNKVRNNLHVVQRRRRGDGVPAPRGRVRRRAAARPDPARPQPARARTAARCWPRSRRDPTLRDDPGRRADDLGGGGGRAAQLLSCTPTPTSPSRSTSSASSRSSARSTSSS